MGCLSNGWMSDRVSDHASRSRRQARFLGKESQSRETSGSGETALGTEYPHIVRAYSASVHTRVHWGHDAAVSRDLRSSRTCASSHCNVTTFSPSRGYVCDDDDRASRGCPVRIVYNSHRLLETPLESSSAKYVVAVTRISVNSFFFLGTAAYISRYTTRQFTKRE